MANRLASGKFTVSEMLRLACLYAEQDREAFIDASSHMPDDPAYREAVAFLRELRAYRRRRWGRCGPDVLDDCKSVPVSQVIRDRAVSAG